MPNSSRVRWSQFRFWHDRAAREVSGDMTVSTTLKLETTPLVASREHRGADKLAKTADRWSRGFSFSKFLLLC